MAYAALVSLSHTIDQFLDHHHHSITDHQNQLLIRSIHEYAIFLQVFFEDFPQKVDNSLEERIRVLANQAEDMIEYFILEQIQLTHASNNSTDADDDAPSPLFKFIPCVRVSKYKHLCYDLDFHELEKVAEGIDSVAAEVMEIVNRLRLEGLRLIDSPSAAAATPSSSRIASIPRRNAAIVGLDDDLLAIKERLCGEPSRLQVIPIVGMGGIGKTTLARNAYLDPLITERFDVHAWVTVSQHYSEREILSGLLDSMKKFNKVGNDVSDEEKVFKILFGRKYLIVMDDMWSTKVWDDVRRIFPDDDNGSRVVLTTRLLDVAAYMDPYSHLHEIRLMGNDQSWDLLHRKVFTHEERCPYELEHIGKKIARGCRGLPLAIVVIGGLLSTVSRTRASWEEIAENVKLAISTTKDGHIDNILSLSYTHLPHHLRSCFLYMGAFPEDYGIRASKLIKLWIVEGFIKSSVSKNFEEMAEDYLEDFVRRNLVLVSERKSNGKIKSCGLHDVIRHLCIGKAQEEKFLVHVTDRKVHKNNIKNHRRLCVTQFDLSCLEKIYGSTTRAIVSFSRVTNSPLHLRNFKFLRVLNLVYDHLNFYNSEEIVWLPSQLFKLFHLRYFVFNCPPTLGGYLYKKILQGISNLQNLQTLIILPGTSKTCAVNLPLEIWTMPKLRHLVCNYFGELPNPDQDRENSCTMLENLHTLSVVTNLVCSESILRMIPNIKKLGIIYYEEEWDPQDYHLGNLVHLHQLEKLKIIVSTRWTEVNPSFPTTLKKLTMKGWGFPWDEDMMRVIGSLPNLQVLKLRDCAYGWNQWETSEGEFPELIFLLICNCYLKDWKTESSHFPRLKSLVLHNFRYLEEIPDGIGEIPTLELIELKSCRKTLAASAGRIQEEQQDYGNDAFEVRCVDCEY